MPIMARVVFECPRVVAQQAAEPPVRQCSTQQRTGTVADLIVVYWRDIPAQVIVKKGRQSARRELPLRFTEAIDMCAMRVGARDTDAYLAEWRRAAPQPVGDDIEAEAEAAAMSLQENYPDDRLTALVKAGGHDRA
jgi:hypothetical protein